MALGKGKQPKDKPVLIGTMSQETLAQIAEVASEPGQPPLTVAQAGALFAARDAIVGGAAVGTIKKGPKGETAVRVNDKGVPTWKITEIDGHQYGDTQPDLPSDWTTIVEP